MNAGIPPQNQLAGSRSVCAMRGTDGKDISGNGAEEYDRLMGTLGNMRAEILSLPDSAIKKRLLGKNSDLLAALVEELSDALRASKDQTG